MGFALIMLWRPAAALSRTPNGSGLLFFNLGSGNLESIFTISEISFYYAGAGGLQRVPPGLQCVGGCAYVWSSVVGGGSGFIGGDRVAIFCVELFEGWCSLFLLTCVV